MKKSVWFWLCFVVAIVIATYFSTRIAMTLMGRGPAGVVHNISITARTPDKDLSQLAAAAAIAPGTSSYAVDLDAIRQRISAVPGVRNAAVRRMPNGNLAVRVEMHRAVAQWFDGENYFPLSADGTIVQRPSDTRDVAGVVFRGPVPDDISDITAAATNMAEKLEYMEWIENRRWNMHTTGGITVMLPEQNPGAAIGALNVLDKNHAILDRKINVVDMRDDARVLVK